MYISRKDSIRRRVVNEDKVISMLKEEGFTVEVILLSTYVRNTKDAHKILHRAALVIGPHGITRDINIHFYTHENHTCYVLLSIIKLYYYYLYKLNFFM